MYDEEKEQQRRAALSEEETQNDFPSHAVIDNSITFQFVRDGIRTRLPDLSPGANTLSALSQVLIRSQHFLPYAHVKILSFEDRLSQLASDSESERSSPGW